MVCPQGLADESAELARRLPSDCVLVVDCYAPALVERALLVPGDPRFAGFRGNVIEALERADLLLVANQPQRVYAQGMLSVLGRVAPERTPPPVILAPMGAPPPSPAGADPAVPTVLWYGGLWPWFDGVTAVGAFADVARQVPTAHLRILGGRHPRGEAPDTLDSVLAAAAALGVADRVESIPVGAPGGRAPAAGCRSHALSAWLMTASSTGWLSAHGCWISSARASRSCAHRAMRSAISQSRRVRRYLSPPAMRLLLLVRSPCSSVTSVRADRTLRRGACWRQAWHPSARSPRRWRGLPHRL